MTTSSKSASAVWQVIQNRDAKAFWVADDGNKTYADLGRRIGEIADGCDFGEPRSRVVISLRDDFDCFASFLAVLLSGRVPSIVSTHAANERVRMVCDAVDATLLLTDRKPGFEYGCRTATPPKTPRWTFGRRKKATTSFAPADTSGDDLAYLLFTSGTTSAPKGVMITWRNLTAHCNTLARVLKVDGDSRIFNPTPISHTDGLVMGSFLALYCGAATVRPGPFAVDGMEAWLKKIAGNASTHVIVNPTILSLVEKFAARDDYFRSTLLVSSAAHISQELWERLEVRFQVRIANLYGLTESVTSALYAGNLDEMGPIATLGVPIDCEVRLGDSAGAPLDLIDGTEGEIQLRGDHIFTGYWKNSEANKSAFTSDGWFRTGDIARFQRDGSYHFKGRLKAAINCGGTLIYGEEIDECILRHANIAEAVTIAIPDPVFEEIPITVVVTKAQVSEAELTAQAERYLEPLRVPKRILQVDAIPRGDSGKPQLTKVRDMVEARLSEAGTSDAVMLANVQALASRVFRTSADSISLSTVPDDVPGWDSFSHLNLVMEAEKEFGFRMPVRKISSIRNIKDLCDAIEVELAK